jgi:hypothetical protein
LPCRNRQVIRRNTSRPKKKKRLDGGQLPVRRPPQLVSLEHLMGNEEDPPLARFHFDK